MKLKTSVKAFWSFQEYSGRNLLSLPEHEESGGCWQPFCNQGAGVRGWEGQDDGKIDTMEGRREDMRGEKGTSSDI